MDFVPGRAASRSPRRSDVPGLDRRSQPDQAVVARRDPRRLPARRARARPALAAQRQPWSVNALACAALAVCCRRSHATPSRRRRRGRRGARRAARRPSRALPGLRVWPSVANFLLARASPDGARPRRGAARAAASPSARPRRSPASTTSYHPNRRPTAATTTHAARCDALERAPRLDAARPPDRWRAQRQVRARAPARTASRRRRSCSSRPARPATTRWTSAHRAAPARAAAVLADDRRAAPTARDARDDRRRGAASSSTA